MGSTGPEFEEEVRRVARALWQADPGQGAPDLLDGKERDCIFQQGPDLTHYVEVTTEKTIAKVRKDADKMVKWRETEAKRGRLVALWIITKHEPTGDQRKHCREDNRNIQILSLKEFRRKVFDAVTYLEIRRPCAFGSARDPENDRDDVWDIRYQPTTFRRRDGKPAMSIAEVADAIRGGQIVLLLGDYGMGKSLAVREVFRRLRTEYLEEHEGPVPVAVNLRDYWGRDRASEVLDRHARDVGLENGISLVRGFNAGQLAMLLDGFDETAARPWSGHNLERLRDMRKTAVAVVREFVKRSRGRSGLLITGREHFFDNEDEMFAALGVNRNDLVIQVDEFAEDEALAFLAKVAPRFDTLPDWLPRRPLLLASFAAKGLLDKSLVPQDDLDPARSWLYFLDSVCRREADIHEFLEADSVRAVLEHLAGAARRTDTGVGPLAEADLILAFKDVTGAAPDSAGLPLLARLPGLSARDTVPGHRSFIDNQFLEILRGRAVASFIRNPREDMRTTGWKHGIGELGMQSAAATLETTNIKAAAAIAAANDAARRLDSPTLALDAVQVGRVLAADDDVDCGGLHLVDAYTPELDLTVRGVPTNLLLVECTIERVACVRREIDGLRLVDCMITQIEGVARPEYFPPYVDASCEVGRFDVLDNNARTLREEGLPLSVRVLLTVLRKLYVQRGSGRKENAFFRGMDESAKRHVEDVMHIVQTQGLAHEASHGGQRVWHAVRRQRARALDILDSMGMVRDPAVVATELLQ